jgi:UDP-N-acetylglucosamine 2-epimerase (non-hydrolysing)
MKVLLVGGARPNFMKIAPVYEELKKYPNKFHPLIVHTGQHYNNEMSKVFFDDLELPEPNIYLGVGSASHAVQTAKIMIEFEKVCLAQRPDLVMVVGDVNSTLACSIVASKLYIPVAHVEAGLRSFDRTMPEEINRIVTDALSQFLFTPCEDANENLVKEGIPNEKIFFVGNIMIDALLLNLERIDNSKILDRLNLNGSDYAVITLHRPSNVDSKEALKEIYDIFVALSKRIKLVYPIHPRARKMIRAYGMEDKFFKLKDLMIIEPLRYIDFIKLMKNARFVMTDSGGIQEETTVLGVPCLTMRENTERPITLIEGTNILVGRDKGKIILEVTQILTGKSKPFKIPKFWDGKTAERIVKVLRKQKK